MKYILLGQETSPHACQIWVTKSWVEEIGLLSPFFPAVVAYTTVWYYSFLQRRRKGKNRFPVKETFFPQWDSRKRKEKKFFHSQSSSFGHIPGGRAKSIINFFKAAKVVFFFLLTTSLPSPLLKTISYPTAAGVGRRIWPLCSPENWKGGGRRGRREMVGGDFGAKFKDGKGHLSPEKCAISNNLSLKSLSPIQILECAMEPWNCFPWYPNLQSTPVGVGKIEWVDTKLWRQKLTATFLPTYLPLSVCEKEVFPGGGIGGEMLIC